MKMSAALSNTPPVVWEPELGSDRDLVLESWRVSAMVPTRCRELRCRLSR